MFYVTKQSRFAATVEVVGKYYYSETQIWDEPYDLWPHRVRTKPIVYRELSEEGIYIKDIWDNLSFIKNKVKWGSQVQGSFKRITEDDYRIIESCLLKR